MVLDHLEKGFSLLLKFLECLLADLRALIEVEDVLDQALRDVLEDEADDIVHGLVLEDGVEDLDRQVNLVFEVGIHPHLLALRVISFLVLEPLKDSLVGFDATFDGRVRLEDVRLDIVQVGDEPVEELLVRGEVSDRQSEQ